MAPPKLSVEEFPVLDSGEPFARTTGAFGRSTFLTFRSPMHESMPSLDDFGFGPLIESMHDRVLGRENS